MLNLDTSNPDRVKILASALKWLLNHYEVGGREPTLKLHVVSRIEAVLKREHNPTIEDMCKFRSAYPLVKNNTQAGTEIVEIDPVESFIQHMRVEFNIAQSRFPGDRVTMIALVEEVGELAKAMLDESAANVWKEAIQTATMAARIAIDGDSSVDDLRTERGLNDHRFSIEIKE